MSACPICRRPAEREYRPFCSRRCANVDLQRWLVGGYAIPGEPDEAGEDAALPPDPDSDD